MLEGDAVQVVRGGVRRIQHPLRLEEFGQGVLVDGVPLAAFDLGDVLPVPRGERRAGRDPGEPFGKCGRLRLGPPRGGRGQRAQQRLDGIGGLGAALLDDQGGVVRVAEQRGAFGADPGDLHDHRAGVELARGGPRGGRLEQFAAQLPVVQLGDQRLPGGVDQVDAEAAVGLAQGVDLVGGRPREPRLVGHDDRGGVAGLPVAAFELGAQLGEPGVQAAQGGLVGVRQGDARPAEALQPSGQRPGRLGVEGDLAGVHPLLQGDEPGVQCPVEPDAVGVRRELGGVLGVERVELVGGVGELHREERQDRPVELRPGPLPRLQHVGLGGRLGVGGQLGEGVELRGHARVEPGAEVGGGEVREVGQLVGQARGGGERVAGVGTHARQPRSSPPAPSTPPAGS